MPKLIEHVHRNRGKNCNDRGVSDGPDFRRLTLVTKLPDLQIGRKHRRQRLLPDLAELPPDKASFDVVKETLDKTNLGLLKAGDFVNLERSMKIGDRIDGHFVQGMWMDGRVNQR